MSAFMVSESHIHAILAYAIKHNLYWDATSDLRSQQISIGCANHLGNLMLDANACGVAARYSERPVGDVYGYEPTQAAPLTMGGFVKALDCLEYQCCDSATWTEGDVYHALQSLRLQALRLTPEYEAAQWEVK